MKRKLSLTVLLATIGLLGLTGGVVIALGQDSNPPASTITAGDTTAPEPSVPLAQSLDPKAEQGFAILREGQAASKIPAAVNTPSVAQRFGTNPSLARSALASDGTRLYAVPGNGALCIATQGSAVCGSVDQAFAGATLVVELCSPSLAPGDVAISGIMPDGVAEVTVASASSGKTVPVVTSVYHVEVPGDRVLTLAWQDAAGQSHAEPIPVPSDYSPDQCSAAVDSAK